jgi:hypothetical protein
MPAHDRGGDAQHAALIVLPSHKIIEYEQADFSCWQAVADWSNAASRHLSEPQWISNKRGQHLPTPHRETLPQVRYLWSVGQYCQGLASRSSFPGPQLPRASTDDIHHLRRSETSVPVAADATGP